MHEMAHVYHDLTDLAVNPAAIAAGRVYLNDFLDGIGVVQEGDCRTKELYADIPGMLMSIDGLRRFGGAAYWSNCRKQGRSLNSWLRDSSRSPELTEVMRSVYVDQEVPQWFYDTYQRADGSWDVEAIIETLGYYVTDQEVPQWFYDTYHDTHQRADGSWDVEALRETPGILRRTRQPLVVTPRYWQLRQLIPEL